MAKAVRICAEPSVLLKSGLVLWLVCAVWFGIWTQTANTATLSPARTLTVFKVSPNLPFTVEASSKGGVKSSLTLVCERQATVDFTTKKSSLFVQSRSVKQFKSVLAEAKGNCLIFASAIASGKVNTPPTLQLVKDTSIIA